MTTVPDTPRPDILCIGAMLWDVIGRAPRRMAPGADVPAALFEVRCYASVNPRYGPRGTRWRSTTTRVSLG